MRKSRWNRAIYEKIDRKLLLKYFRPYLCTPFRGNNTWQGEREFSSAGSEHLPYKQRVGGSNPSTPTKKIKHLAIFC
jgi:hypothetical protein